MIIHSAIAPCEECGVRCSVCDERMCNLFGPESSPIDADVCVDCDLPREQRIDAAEDRADQVARDVLREVGL